MSDNQDSVYSLITQLCEKFTNDPKVVKKLRTKSYEILLGKNEKVLEAQAKSIKYPDVFTEALAWQFTLTHQYGLPDLGKKFIEKAEFVHAHGGDNALKFLLCLRKPPKINQKKLSILDDNDNDLFSDLPASFRDLFDIPKPMPQFEEEKEAIEEQVIEEDLWEVALKEKYRTHRNWEDYGHPEPDKEPLFLSELASGSNLWVENLSLTRNHVKVKSLPEFVNDIKFLLVGIAYWSFTYDDKSGFKLIPDLSIQGVTTRSLENFCKDFLFCGSCCRALREISIPDPKSGQYKHPGYIFTELCVNINRYLEVLTTKVLNIPDSIGLIDLKERTEMFRNQISTLSKVCRIGPFSKSGLPKGVWLLNHLYQSIISSNDDNVMYILYSIFYPCCQVYFMRFLQPWLLEGRIDDPFEEFFIKPEFKYISTRGRTYWTRSYVFRQDMIPDFWLDLTGDILNCGKAMNLLKLCDPKNKLNLYLRGTKPHIISCCVTPNQLVALERNVTIYKFEILSECGPIIELDSLIRKQREQDQDFAILVAKKRAATLKRIELERLKMLEEEKQRKMEEFASLKEQLDSALRQKEQRIAAGIKEEMKTVEFELSVEAMKDKVIKEEARTMTIYYEDLIKTSENRKKIIDKQIESFKEVASNSDNEIALLPEGNSSVESFYSLGDEVMAIPSSKSLDVINANLPTLQKPVIESNGNVEVTTVTLSEAQRNKLRVMGTEFGLDLAPRTMQDRDRVRTQSEINRNHMMRSNEVFDNALYHVDVKKSRSLALDLSKISEICITDPERPTPMSVDSTPMSDSTSTISRVLLTDREEVDSIPATACTQMTDDGFDFDERPTEAKSYVFVGGVGKTSLQKPIFSKRVSASEAKNVSKDCLKRFLHESVALPLETSLKLVDNQLLKYFIEDLDYLRHLQCLRDYFFLQDGEFGRNITENLFEKLYDARFPIELINFRTLQNLVVDGLHNSIKYQGAGDLSFKINSLPKTFHLGDPNVLDCVSLTYRVKWPLNILLPVDSVNKYGDVFKFLLRVNRISWVLKKIFMELKILAKETGKKQIYLMMSPQYRRLHQCRHVMLHFAQTLQNYIVGEVLEPSWVLFERNLASVTNLDSLYAAHTTYIKNILFLCLLNQKSAPLRKVMEKIFVVILKFYDYLRSCMWKCEDGVYVHPNFAKLESIFNNFEEFIVYFFKFGRKVARSGYQPHLTQLLDMLDVSGYYSNKISSNNG